MLSAVIVSWNTKEILRKCLEFLQGEEVDELIVVDNASIDGSLEMVTQNFREVNLIINAENYGFAKAANIGLRSSSCALVLLLNSDVFIDQQAIKKMKIFMQNNTDVMIAAPSLFSPQNKKIITLRPLHNLSYMILEHLFIFKFFPFFKKCIPKYIQGAALLFRRSTFKKVGYFDERFFFYAEDADFCLRSMKKGLQMKVISDAQGIHLCGESSQKKDREKYYIQRIHADLLFLEKYYPRSIIICVKNLIRVHFIFKSTLLKCFSYFCVRNAEMMNRASIYREIASGLKI